MTWREMMNSKGTIVPSNDANTLIDAGRGRPFLALDDAGRAAAQRHQAEPWVRDARPWRMFAAPCLAAAT